MTSRAILRSWAELVAHERAWWELLERSDQNHATMTPFWLGAWWRVFGNDGRHLRALLVFDQGRLIGLAPLLSRLHWYRSGVPFRRLELVGSGEPEADEICSEYLGVLTERGRQAQVLSELVNALTTAQLGRWDEVIFPALCGEGAGADSLIEALQQSGLVTRTTVTAECPYIRLPASWDEYLGSLSSSARHYVRRSLASFEQWADGDAEFRDVRSMADLEQGSAVLHALHEQRWSATGRDGVFASQRFRAFHDEVMRALLARGALDLSWILVRGEPIAALYNFVWNGSVNMYQAGRKLDVPPSVRPGIINHLHSIRRAIEAGHREYDFLGGASPYKLKLATAKRPLLAVRAVQSRALERVRVAAERGIGQVRATAERGIDLVRLLARHA
ncbi:MAG TPA: GNAT family N-acetyltransferase [Polyangiaceae bacterium]|nr:GNAT family N-acetyltransferase [Polyangiaceae bacterium]